MNPLKIESNRNRQTVWMLTASGLGAWLVFSMSAFGHGWFESAGFVLGMLLVAAGVAGLYLGTTRAVVIDPRTGFISIEDTNRVGQRKRSIPFKEVVSAYLNEMVDTSGGMAYDVMLKLKSGKTISLFGGAAFDGTHDRAVMAERCRRIGQYLQHA